MAEFHCAEGQCEMGGLMAACRLKDAEIERLRTALQVAIEHNSTLPDEHWSSEIAGFVTIVSQQSAPEVQRCAECACDDPPSQCDWIKPSS